MCVLYKIRTSLVYMDKVIITQLTMSVYKYST